MKTVTDIIRESLKPGTDAAEYLPITLAEGSRPALLEAMERAELLDLMNCLDGFDEFNPQALIPSEACGLNVFFWGSVCDHCGGSHLCFVFMDARRAPIATHLGYAG